MWPLDRVIANIEQLLRDHGATFFPCSSIARARRLGLSGQNASSLALSRFYIRKVAEKRCLRPATIYLGDACAPRHGPQLNLPDAPWGPERAARNSLGEALEKLREKCAAC